MNSSEKSGGWGGFETFQSLLTRAAARGGHGRLYYGDCFTTLKDRTKEIGPGLLKAMLEQLGLDKDSLESP
jgi:hypothetical protein